MRNNKSYVPRTIGALKDKLASMMFSAPTFRDRSGYFPQMNIDTEFYSLNEGLKCVRDEIGEKRYQECVALSDRMRAHFEADPEDKTHDSIAGRELIHEIENLLTTHRRKSSS